MTEETQRCTTCDEDKPLHEYSLRSSITKARHRVCKECHKKVARKDYQKNRPKYLIANKKWAEDNPEKRKQVARVSAKKIAQEQKRLAVEYKGGKCEDCNGVFQQCAYDFHHVDPKGKDMHLAQALSARGFEFCREELDKCVLLCANCHRVRHHGS